MSTFRKGRIWPFEVSVIRAACPNDVPTWAGVEGWHDAYMTYLHPRLPAVNDPNRNIRWKVAPSKPE